MPDPKYDVFVNLEDDEWLYVASCSSDLGEITAACQVLFPMMLGVWIDSFKENRDAEG